MNAIRWPGFIAFLVFIIIITGGCWLFAESIAESIAESTLTDLNGAKVDIESVDLKYSPLSITINDIQVTDPDKPMTNMLQIGRASFALSFGDLLLKKLVIDEMAINKIQVDTPRKKSGAVKKLVTEKKTAKPADDSAIDFIIPDLDLPDVDDILNREKLQSESLVTDLNQDLETTQDNWDRISKDINNQQRWNEYQSRYNKIKQDFKGDTQSKLAALKDAKALKDDLNREKTSIQKARKQFSEDNRRLSDKFKAVKQAPGDDVKRLREKYGIGNMDAQNITQLLFGQQAAEYIKLAEKWYNRIKPYIEDSPEEIAEKEAKQRQQGQDIKFREFNPRPDFYVRIASIDASLPRGEFTGSITDISSNQAINKKPMRLKLSGNNLRHRKSETFTAEFNYINPEKGFSTFKYDITEYQLTDFSISHNDKLPLAIKSGMMNFRLDSRLANKQLAGTGNINFNRVNFKSAESGTSNFTQMLASSFSNISQFDINTRFSGSLHNLNFRLDSNLDNQLGTQLKNQLKQRGQEYEQKLKAGINQKLGDPMSKLEDKKKQLDKISNDIDNREQEIKTKLADIENNIKNSSKTSQDKKVDALKDKLKSKFKL